MKFYLSMCLFVYSLFNSFILHLNGTALVFSTAPVFFLIPVKMKHQGELRIPSTDTRARAYAYALSVNDIIVLVINSVYHQYDENAFIYPNFSQSADVGYRLHHSGRMHIHNCNKM